MLALRTTGLVKQFGTVRALDDVTMQVADGEVHGLLGPNGAGKTTLLRILFGLVRPDAGSLELLGHEVGSAEARPAVAGFVEEPRFYPYLSGRANLEVLAQLDGGTESGAIADVLARVQLDERQNDRVGAYSTGMRQRLGIAAALLRKPQLLLLDEPTVGLDPQGLRDMGALLRELSASGTAVLLSSHQIGEVEDVCDAVTVLRRGSVVWSGAIAELRAQAPASTYRLVTSDDSRALEVIGRQPLIDVVRSHRDELTVRAVEHELDALVLTLAHNDIAVRRLELLVSPLEAVYFSLTSDDAEHAHAS